jgi:hydrogenase maturation protease
VKSSLARAAWRTTITSTEAVRVLVGGVGYRFLRDASIGPWVTEQLSPRATPEIEVEDLSYHPIGFVHNLKERPPYDRLVVVGSIRRGREPGTVSAYTWDRELPPADEIQARVSEAVTGVISLDNLLIVSAALGELPGDVRVVEVEPADEGWGDGFSPEIEEKLSEVVETAWTLAAP